MFISFTLLPTCLAKVVFPTPPMPYTATLEMLSSCKASKIPLKVLSLDSKSNCIKQPAFNSINLNCVLYLFLYLLNFCLQFPPKMFWFHRQNMSLMTH
ncbi:hypothetical protein AAHE18_17G045400 [Arachis hypogaea]